MSHSPLLQRLAEWLTRGYVNSHASFKAYPVNATEIPGVLVNYQVSLAVVENGVLSIWLLAATGENQITVQIFLLTHEAYLRFLQDPVTFTPTFEDLLIDEVESFLTLVYIKDECQFVGPQSLTLVTEVGGLSLVTSGWHITKKNLDRISATSVQSGGVYQVPTITVSNYTRC